MTSLEQKMGNIQARRGSEGVAAKASCREFYDRITSRLDELDFGDLSLFLNYGYISLGAGDEGALHVTERIFNANSVRLVYELVGKTDLRGQNVLDVGCGRGGVAALLTERFRANVVGIDLAPKAIAFCRRVHRDLMIRFEIGDAENLPIEGATFDAVTSIESSHAYPDLEAFLSEVRRVLKTGGLFLYTDFLPVQLWIEVRIMLPSLHFDLLRDRDITSNVLASCDAVSARRARAFDTNEEWMDTFLAVPGSSTYADMRSGALEYRIIRAAAD
jgi:SAM-dependent methyltransferase